VRECASASLVAPGTVYPLFPFVVFDRPGVHLLPGESVDLWATGYWGFASGDLSRVDETGAAPAQDGPRSGRESAESDETVRLGLVASIPGHRRRVGRTATRFLAEREGDLIVSPYLNLGSRFDRVPSGGTVGLARIVIER
jgi:hypothetical protein